MNIFKFIAGHVAELNSTGALDKARKYRNAAIKAENAGKESEYKRYMAFAEAELRKSIIREDSTTAHYLLGSVLEGLGRLEEALAQYEAGAISPKEYGKHYRKELGIPDFRKANIIHAARLKERLEAEKIAGMYAKSILVDAANYASTQDSAYLKKARENLALSGNSIDTAIRTTVSTLLDKLEQDNTLIAAISSYKRLNHAFLQYINFTTGRSNDLSDAIKSVESFCPFGQREESEKKYILDYLEKCLEFEKKDSDIIEHG